jgi:DNA-binding Xre family transcriptional regulator
MLVITLDKYVTDERSLYAISQRSGVSYPTLHELKTGKRTDMYLKSLDKLITALREMTGEEITPNDLLEYIPDKSAKSKK